MPSTPVNRPFRIGERLRWTERTAPRARTRTGIVREVYTHRISHGGPDGHTSRAGSAADPAYVIELADGRTVLRLHSELDRGE